MKPVTASVGEEDPAKSLTGPRAVCAVQGWAAVPSFALACAWVTIALTKLLAAPAAQPLVHEREATVWLARLLDPIPSWLPTLVEFSLGGALLLAWVVRRPRWLSWSVMASAFVACLLLTIAVLSEDAPKCGCFGALSAPVRAQRIGVAGGLLLLSLVASGRRAGPSPALAHGGSM